MKLRLLAATLSLALFTAAQASDETFHRRWYVGLAGGVTKLEPDTNNSGFTVTDDESNGTKLVLGRDLSHRFSIEAYAADLGEVLIDTSDEITYEVYGAQLVMHLYNNGSDLGRYFRDGLSLYAKLGAGGMSNDATIPFEQLSDVFATYGVGASGLMGAGFSWRLEAEAFDENVAMVSLGIIKRFGDVPDPSPPSVDYFKSQRGTAQTSITDEIPEADDSTDVVAIVDEAETLDTEDALDDTVVSLVPEGEQALEIDDDVASSDPVADAQLPIDSPQLAEGADVTAVVAADPVNSLESTEIDSAPAVEDSDGDGVPNQFDRCGDTPAGKIVDDAGCSFAGVVEGLYFDSSSSDLNNASREILDGLIFELLKHPTVLLEVQAHTDNRGPARGNLELSQARAQAVVRYMIQGGISSTRLRAVGYGESRPAFQNATEEGRRRNRRVEFRTIELPRQ